MQTEKPDAKKNVNNEAENRADNAAGQALPETEPVTTPHDSEARPFSVAEPVKDSGFRRFLNFLFGADTRVGRVMRPVLRTLALIVISLGAGLLVAYFTLYLPLREQRDTAAAEIQRLNGVLGEAQTSAGTVQDEMKSLQTRMEELQTENDRANFKIFFLIAKNDVLRARLALVDDSGGPGGPTALAALNDLEAHLQDLLPFIETTDPVLADLLLSRLEVVRGELGRDAEQAVIELEGFYSNLLELEATLFE